jgi:hypothetical protein|tara:strand:+ start:1749 stop:1976 length:228 start_codon:yes stop_codon:yes gene_type:complete
MSNKNLFANEDPMWQTHMQTLMRRKRSMEIAQTIDKVLEDYYSEKGESVPNWKQQKDPQWWLDYLKELNIDQNNS